MNLLKRFDLSLNLLWQPVLASVYIAFAIYCLSAVSKGSFNWAVGLGALASSAFSVFAVPSAITSRSYSIAVGYLIAICAGVVMDYIITHSSLYYSRRPGWLPLHSERRYRKTIRWRILS